MLLITKGNWGGAQKYVYNIATSPYVRKDFTVEVVSGTEGELLDRLRQKGINTYCIPQKNSVNPFGSILELIRMVNFLRKEKPDIIHTNSSKMGLLGTVAGKIAGVKHIVFTAHGWVFHEERTLPMKFFFRVLQYLTVYLADKTIAIGEHIKTSIKAPKFLRKKIVVVYNGIEKTEQKKLPKLSLGSNVRHVVNIGELHPNKGHDIVLNILPHVENVHYHIIGEGAMRSKLEKIIEKKNLGGRVTMYGHKENAAALLPQYDLFLMASRKEGLPYVILEALQAGLPVVARRVGSIPEILQGLPSGKLFTHDSELMELLKEDIPETVDWKDSRFELDTMIKKTVYEYERLLDGKVNHYRELLKS